MSKNVLKALFVLGVLSTVSVNAMAGKLVVKNENGKAMVLQIVPEGASMGFVLKQTIPAGQEFVFDIQSAAIENKSIYSVAGDTNVFTSGDKCKNLHVDKNYTLTFTDDKMGTTCVATELVK